MFWFSKSGISSKYTFSSSPTFFAEPWTVYTGRPKDSSSSTTSSKVSVFIFDKKRFETQLLTYGIVKSKNSSQDRMLISEVYEILRTQVSNLAKLKHPNILHLVEPLEEHSKNFMFVTEYVTGSLESAFTNVDEELSFLKGHVREDIVIQRGILEVTQALEFIHNRASCVHLDIQPRSVFINDNSDWKVSGLGHLFNLPQSTNSAEYFIRQYDPRIPAFVNLALDYTAPEIVFDNTVSFKSDYFSLGILALKLYTNKTLLNTENSAPQYREEYTKFERRLFSRSWEGLISDVPYGLKICIPKLLNRDLSERYGNISDFLNCEFFQDPLMKTLNFLDDLPTKDRDDRLLYLEGLTDLLPKYPTSLLQRKFLTVLLNLLTQLCGDLKPDRESISMNVHLVIRIGATLSQLTFQEKILPVLLTNSNFAQILHYATLPLVENVSTLKEKIRQEDFMQVILKPLSEYVFRDMKGELTVPTQEKLLEKMTLLTDIFDFVTTKNFLLPLLCELFGKTTSLAVKIATISCFQALVEHKDVDGDLICQEVLPLFQQMKTREPRILMQSLKLFEIVPNVVNRENLLVEQLLPLLWTYSLAPTLQASQYAQYTQTINKISTNVQTKHMESLAKTKGSRDFNKLIESTESKGPRPEDVDTKNANSIATPAIQPIRKVPVKQTITEAPRSAKFTEELPSRAQLTRSRPPKPKPISQDDFDEFMSAPLQTATPKPSLSPYSNNLSAPKGSNKPTTYNNTEIQALPPGFSVSLQPTKK